MSDEEKKVVVAQPALPRPRLPLMPPRCCPADDGSGCSAIRMRRS
jgi:hypothetical protein